MPTNSSRAYISVFSSALFFFFIFIQLNMFNALDPYLIKDFKISAVALGNLSAAYFYATIIFLIPAGMILDRLSTRRVIITAMSISIVCTIVFAISHHFYQAFTARFIIGLCGAFCLLSSVRLASRWFSGDKMAFVIGCVVTIAMLGGMVAQTPFTLMADHWGWRLTLLADAALGGVLLLMIIAFVADTPTQRHHKPTTANAGIKSIACDLIKVAQNAQNWLAGSYTALLNLPIFLLGAMWGSLYLTDMDGLSRPSASIVTTSLFIGTIIGSPVVGYLSDRWKKRVFPMQMGAIASLIIILALIYTPHLSFLSLMILFFLLGFTSSSQVISYPLIIESNPLSLTGAAEGLASILIMGSGLLQPVFGSLMQYHHSANTLTQYHPADFYRAMSLLPIAFIIALFLCFALKESSGKTLIKQEDNNHGTHSKHAI